MTTSVLNGIACVCSRGKIGFSALAHGLGERHSVAIIN